jgi:ABC-type multidrug transport system fused ATPase/permease subunit
MTYTALKLGRNMRHDYMRSALRRDISFFDHGSVGSISMQATSNGRLIQCGTSEKLGQMIQATATLIAAFIIAFITQWKLTLILICIVPALILMVGTAGGIDAGIETDMLKIYAQTGAIAESSLEIYEQSTPSASVQGLSTDTRCILNKRALSVGRKTSCTASCSPENNSSCLPGWVLRFGKELP